MTGPPWPVGAPAEAPVGNRRWWWPALERLRGGARPARGEDSLASGTGWRVATGGAPGGGGARDGGEREKGTGGRGGLAEGRPWWWLSVGEDEGQGENLGG